MHCTAVSKALLKKVEGSGCFLRSEGVNFIFHRVNLKALFWESINIFALKAGILPPSDYARKITVCRAETVSELKEPRLLLQLYSYCRDKTDK